MQPPSKQELHGFVWYRSTSHSSTHDRIRWFTYVWWQTRARCGFRGSLKECLFIRSWHLAEKNWIAPYMTKVMGRENPLVPHSLPVLVSVRAHASVCVCACRCVSVHAFSWTVRASNVPTWWGRSSVRRTLFIVYYGQDNAELYQGSKSRIKGQ